MDILLSMGYRKSRDDEYGYTYFCGMMEQVEMYSPTGKCVCLSVYPTESYENYLTSLDEDTEVEWDFNRMKVTGILFESCICNVAGFMDNSRPGIFLNGERHPYAILDNMGGMDEYYPHVLTDSLFKKCAWIQEHPIEHEMKIIQCHCRNMKKVVNDYLPILNKYDFYQEYSSVLDADVESGHAKDSSNPFITFQFKHGSHTHTLITFETDCITGKLLLNGEEFKGDFEKWMVEEHLFDKKYNEYYLEFRYLFDSNYKPETANEIWHALEMNRELKEHPEYFDQWYKNTKINWDLIPECEMYGGFKELKEKLA